MSRYTRSTPIDLSIYPSTILLRIRQNHDLFFLIEYEDMVGQDRWVPWSVVKTQPLIHDYMRNDVQLASRIPRYTRKDKRLIRLDHQRHQVIEEALSHNQDLTDSPSA